MGPIALTPQKIIPLESITEQVDSIPMLPHVVMRLLSIIGSANHSLQEVVKLVETDASLTAKILRVANSAAFFRGNPVNTVSKAVINLGEKMVAGIAIGSCTTSVFKKPLEGYDSPEGELWQHSLRAAIASRETAAFTSHKDSADLAFTSGLLHDIGKAIISEFLTGTTEAMTTRLDEGNVEDFLAAEKEQIGIDHTEVGYTLANHWNLPEPICEAIKHHHHPSQAPEAYRPLAYVVHLGDIFAMIGGTGTGADALGYRVDNAYENYIQMGKEDLPALLLAVQEEFAKTITAVFPE